MGDYDAKKENKGSSWAPWFFWISFQEMHESCMCKITWIAHASPGRF